MLFNSYEFLFYYLPLTLFGFFVIGSRRPRAAALWLFCASLVFYGWWNPRYVGLLLVSIGFNFLVGRALALRATLALPRRGLLAAGIAVDLLLLGYYKYANFFVQNLDRLTGGDHALATIVLPLGISFFTFTQIAFLVDAHRGEVKETDPIHYGLFVTYFPHLIAVPILHHKEIMPQFDRPETYRPNYPLLAMGLTIFVLGLVKKVILADGVAVFVGPIFAPANVVFVPRPTLLEAWGGTLAYSFQIYFDFSGYSDMAIGLALLFGIRFPLNFASPYKATSMIDFWRCWHMTLSRFLRDYLYFPLGGNRKGPARRYVNLLVTMLLGGLWHGAGWTFVVWGGLHGLYLALNHGWRALQRRLGSPRFQGRTATLASWAVTFVAVVFAWVFFRADNLEAAWSIIRCMAGANGIALPDTLAVRLGALALPLEHAGIEFRALKGFAGTSQIAWLIGLLAISLALPNTQQLLSAHHPVLEHVAPDSRGPARWLRWQPSWPWATVAATLSLAAVANLGKVSEFIYFQF